MKKIGLIAGMSFLAGALFFALTFGYLQKSDVEESRTSGAAGTVLGPSVARADAIDSNTNGNGFAPLVKKVRPAVVKVISETVVTRRGRYGDDFFDRFFRSRPRRERVSGVGSGFFISSDGYIITNNHVVKDAVSVKIQTLDDNEYKARVIGTDPRTDLALLKVKGKDLPFIQLGDSNRVEVGEWVLAIGNPLAQDLSVTAGIISAKGRQLGVAQYEDFLQTDASINRGNSGGPLINMSGKVIGINSVILAPTGGNIGIGFSIPSNMARKVIDDLKTEGRVVRGYLGVGVQAVSDEDAKDLDLETGGALVMSVEENSPADKAGLKKYDLIVSVSGKKVKNGSDVARFIADSSPGDTVEIVIYRGSKKMTVKAVVAEAPDTLKYRTLGEGDDESDRLFDLGMILKENSRSLARQYDLKTTRGLYVSQINPNSAAGNSQLQKGDVILEVNRREVDTVEEFRREVAKKKPGSQLLLYVNRDGDEGLVRFRLPE